MKEKKQLYNLNILNNVPKNIWYSRYSNCNIEVYKKEQKFYTVWGNSEINSEHIKSCKKIEKFNPEKLGFIDTGLEHDKKISYKQHKQIEGVGIFYTVYLDAYVNHSFEPRTNNLWNICVYKNKFDRDKSEEQNLGNTRQEKIYVMDVKLDSHEIAKEFFDNLGGYYAPAKFLTWLPNYGDDYYRKKGIKK